MKDFMVYFVPTQNAYLGKTQFLWNIGQSDRRILKSTVSVELIVEWVDILYKKKFSEAESYFNYFMVCMVKNGCSYSVHGILKLAVSQERIKA